MWTKVLNVNWSAPFISDKIIVRMLTLIFCFDIIQSVLFYWFFVSPGCGWRAVERVTVATLFPLKIHFNHSINAKRRWINSIKYLDYMLGDAVTAVAVATAGFYFDFSSQWDCVTHSAVQFEMEIYWKPKFLSISLCHDAGEYSITKRRTRCEKQKPIAILLLLLLLLAWSTWWWSVWKNARPHENCATPFIPSKWK